MESIIIESTKSTPKVILDPENKIFSITGQSYPENANGFYKPILQWLREYLENFEHQLNLDLHLIYLNTSSSKSIMDLIEILNDAFNAGMKVTISWYYDIENISAFECGEEFKEDQDLPFELIQV